MKEKLQNNLERFENSAACTAVRNGLIAILPVLFIGIIALIIKNIPIPAYIDFFDRSLIFKRVVNCVYYASFGMLSVFATAFISLSYPDRRSINNNLAIGQLLTSLFCFFILIGVGNDRTWISLLSLPNTVADAKASTIEAFGVNGLFCAIVCATFISWIYQCLFYRLNIRIYSIGDVSDTSLKRSIAVFLPAMIIIILFAIICVLVAKITNVSNFYELYTQSITALFMKIAIFFNKHNLSFFTGLLYVLFSTMLWFIGIHGTDVLESAMINVFVNGSLPYLKRPLFDSFVLMGGCGTTMCLLLSILLFSKKAGNKQLVKYAAFPMLFNINEIMLFGFPVIYNVYLLIPFLVTPLVSYSISYFAFWSGLVPQIVNYPNFTTPILYSGWYATDSFRGMLLQIFCLAVGVAIYRPFVKLYDRVRDDTSKLHLHELEEIMKDSEKKVVEVKLTELSGIQGQIANSLANDFRYAVASNDFVLYYQGQFLKDGTCAGAEALMRFNHPQFGLMYPPLMMKLAEENGILTELEKKILIKALKEAKDIHAVNGNKIEIGVNVLPSTLEDESYLKILEQYAKENGKEAASCICLEVTEQTALMLTAKTNELFNHVHELGYKLAIDDFSMGHTSLSYLQNNQFDMVKLDGAIVMGSMENPRCRDIIASIISLSRTLEFKVLAEYVETTEERDMLDNLGCAVYQGWLYGKAIPKDQFIEKIKSADKGKK